jgi:hypothetical protein
MFVKYISEIDRIQIDEWVFSVREASGLGKPKVALYSDSVGQGRPKDSFLVSSD